MPAEIDNIEIRPDPRGFGWLLSIQDSDTHVTEFLIGDAIQFHAETERTLGKWLADGPDDFHGPTTADLIGPDIAGVLADAAEFHGGEDDQFVEARALGTVLGMAATGRIDEVLKAADPDLARDIERGK